ncbi:hypothetical protein D5I55_08435 [Chakrabartia godavariana]|nr:hypothetical protein D5I55_08435 [Chakrabartia godavariana]
MQAAIRSDMICSTRRRQNMRNINSAEAAQAFICSHALLRGQQRGIKHSDRELVFNYGDREEHAGGGLFRLSISSRQLKFLQDRKIITPSQAERCSRLTLVTDGWQVVTNYRASRAH